MGRAELVKVMVAAKTSESPAKKADWEGVISTVSPEEAIAVWDSRFGRKRAIAERQRGEKWRCGLGEEMYLAAAGGPKRAVKLSPTACQIPLHPLLDLINSSDHCYTTSSCSGRISVYLAPAESPEPSESLQQIVEESEDGSIEPDAPSANLDAVEGEENGGRGKGAARSQTINGRTGGSYIWSSHTQVKVPTEEYEVMDLLFKGVPVLPWEDTAPLVSLRHSHPFPLGIRRSHR